MKPRWWMTLLVLSIPAFVFLNIWQSFRYYTHQYESVEIRTQQRVWLEKNKQLMTGIAVLSAPRRIDQLSSEDLNLRKALPEEILEIDFSSSAGGFR